MRHRRGTIGDARVILPQTGSFNFPTAWPSRGLPPPARGFVRAGRELATLHVGYAAVAPYSLTETLTSRRRRDTDGTRG